MAPRRYHGIKYRDPQRHTRAQPANGLYGEIKHRTLGPIRREVRQRGSAIPDTIVRPFLSADLPPVPPLNPAPVPPPVPIVHPPFTPRDVTTTNPGFLYAVTHAAGKILPYLNIQDYWSLRLVSHAVAATFDLWLPGIVTPSGTNMTPIDGVSVVCTNTPRNPMISMAPGINYPAPAQGGPSSIARLPYPRGFSEICGQTAAHHPDWQFRSCQGYALGVEHDPGSDRDPKHAQKTLVCENCARGDWQHRDIHRYRTERMIALCYHCSVSFMADADWAECTCDTDFRPLDPSRRLPDGSDYYLCGPCRERDFDLVRHRIVEQCERRGLRPTNPLLVHGVNRYIPLVLMGYINNASLDNRNYCLCGRSYQDIKRTMPLILDPDGDSHSDLYKNLRYVPDFTRMVRLCLLCNKHVSAHRIREWSSIYR